MTNETFHKLLNKMCGYSIFCDKCPLNEPKKKAGGTCKQYIEDHGLAVRDIVKGWALERGLLPDNGNQEEAPDTRQEILQAAERCVCGDRDQDYGGPENSFEAIGALWGAYLWHRHELGKPGNAVGKNFIDPKDVAAMMVLFKMARVATGQNKADNWVDAAGYAACGGEVSAKKEAEQNGN